MLGSIGQPYIGELFIGHAGGSRLEARGQKRPLKVRPCPGLSGAIIAEVPIRMPNTFAAGMERLLAYSFAVATAVASSKLNTTPSRCASKPCARQRPATANASPAARKRHAFNEKTQTRREV